MKKLLLYSLFAFAVLLSPSVMAQQGIGTNTPEKSSALEIRSNKRGLLIPRLQLESTVSQNPIPAGTTPVNSLLVYNLATTTTGTNDVTPGFYFWDTDHWVRFVDGDNEHTTTVTAGENITVDVDDTDPNNTEYTVNVAGGATDQMVLVTKYVNGTDATDGTTTEWINYSDFLDDLIAAENGVTYNATNGTIELGGDLTRDTTISVKEFNMIFDGGSDVGGTIKLTNLAEMATDAAIPAGATVAVMLSDGTLQTYNLATLISSTDANNGLTKVNDTLIQLGGNLIKPTIITTGIDADGVTANANNTLAIENLAAAAADNEIVVAEDAGGVLRTVKRSISTTTSIALAVDAIGEYSPYVQEINISATLSGSDYNITLPDATVSNGQVVNIKIANTDDAHDGFLNIIAGGSTLTYGTMPYQGWVIKSNGADWVIVGRN